MVVVMGIGPILEWEELMATTRWPNVIHERKATLRWYEACKDGETSAIEACDLGHMILTVVNPNRGDVIYQNPLTDKYELYRDGKVIAVSENTDPVDEIAPVQWLHVGQCYVDSIAKLYEGDPSKPKEELYTFPMN